MPRWEYTCKNEPCKKTFEQEFSSYKSRDEKEAAGEVKCPYCGSTDHTREFPTGTGFQLKGPGWTGKINPKRR